MFDMTHPSVAPSEPQNVLELIQQWDSSPFDSPDVDLPGISTFAELYEYISYLSKVLYYDYERDNAASIVPLLDRIDEWIKGATSAEDKRAMFEAVVAIRYVSRSEANSLYQYAFRGPFTRWVMSRAGITLSNFSDEQLNDALSKVWIGGASDSFHVDSFFHITEAPSHTNRRPAWLDLAEFGDRNRVAEHMEQHELGSVAIFEDFVGSGTQISAAVAFALSLPNQPDVFVCPIIACPAARTTLASLGSQPRLTYVPLVELSNRNMVPELAPPNEAPHLRKLRDCIEHVASAVSPTIPKYGYKGAGALVVQHSNAPDNCPSLIWHSSPTWTALFPRQHRSGGG